MTTMTNEKRANNVQRYVNSSKIDQSCAVRKMREHALTVKGCLQYDREQKASIVLCCVVCCVLLCGLCVVAVVQGLYNKI